MLGGGCSNEFIFSLFFCLKTRGGDKEEIIFVKKNINFYFKKKFDRQTDSISFMCKEREKWNEANVACPLTFLNFQKTSKANLTASADAPLALGTAAR